MKKFNLVIAPMGSGKTHWSKLFPGSFFDVDITMRGVLKHELKTLRRKPDWTTHNLKAFSAITGGLEVWTEQHVEAFVFDHTGYFCLGREFEEFVGPDVYVILPPIATAMMRVASRTPDDPREQSVTMALCMRNHQSALRAIERYRSTNRDPIFLSWENAFEKLDTPLNGLEVQPVIAEKQPTVSELMRLRKRLERVSVDVGFSKPRDVLNALDRTSGRTQTDPQMTEFEIEYFEPDPQ
uniref:Uncharacterized protein n=1 Tax=viral metagenome TaxID=1070528 RepID=A0A2V0RKM7_9ZZZZ